MLSAPRLPDAAQIADEWAGSHRHLTFAVHDREVHYLTALALASPDELFAHMLLKKLKLSKKLGNDISEARLVGVNSHVEFVDGEGQQRTVWLLHSPASHDAPNGISIASLTAAGLIGLSEGQAILWPDAAGAFRPLKVIRIAAPETGRMRQYA
jgi:regulator of nucleoside diphosphate kinase